MAKKQKPKRLQLSIIVTEEQLAGLRALSASTLAPINALVRRAIEETLETHQKDAKVVKAGEK